MDLRELRRNWEALGARDPLWGILSVPEKRGGRWDPDEFFATGREQVANLLARLEELGVRPGRREALDFGCGVGRLSQALADHFDHVTGVDIACSMVERARGYNRHGERCTYVANDRPDLRFVPDDSTDLVLSLLVLQHVEPRFAWRYLDEFVRVLAPEGAVIVQLVTRAHGGSLHSRLHAISPAMHRAARRLRNWGRPAVDMHVTPPERARRAFERAGAEIVGVDGGISLDGLWELATHFVRKPPRPAAAGRASAESSR
ncbi:MAG: methyltransferase domain-containing protein [Gemmatimonadota bacterium]